MDEGRTWASYTWAGGCGRRGRWAVEVGRVRFNSDLNLLGSEGRMARPEARRSLRSDIGLQNGSKSGPACLNVEGKNGRPQSPKKVWDDFKGDAKRVQSGRF